MSTELLLASPNPFTADRLDSEADDNGGLDLSLSLGFGGSARKNPKPRAADHDGSRRRLTEGIKSTREDGTETTPRVDRAAVEAWMTRSRAHNRELKEEAALSEGRRRHGVSDIGNGAPCPAVAPTLSLHPSTSPLCKPCPYPLMYHYNHLVQYEPISGGLGFQCLMPSWAPTMSPAIGGLNRTESNVKQTAVTKPPDGGTDEGQGFGAAEGGGISLELNSTGSSTSAISNRLTGTLEGGSTSSSDSLLNTRHSKAEERRQYSDEVNTNSRCLRPNLPSAFLCSVKRAAFNDKPACEQPAQKPYPSPRMPIVSTTGNGPNGKTINGVLLTYRQSEVRILCVCHGKTLTPEEFVRHAGGIHTSQPMRQIVVLAEAR